MTKEELEKEAEEKYGEVDREFIACQDEGEVFNIGYVLGAEPREKRIAELEKENAELKEDLETQKRINIEMINPVLDRAIKQLTKATEIIKKYLSIGVGGKITQNYLDVTKEAEQFIKDSKGK